MIVEHDTIVIFLRGERKKGLENHQGLPKTYFQGVEFGSEKSHRIFILTVIPCTIVRSFQKRSIWISLKFQTTLFCSELFSEGRTRLKIFGDRIFMIDHGEFP